MAQSVPIAALGVATLPEDYTIPDSLEIVPLAVRASFDGSGASGTFYPTLEFLSPGGVVIAECPCFTTIAAGGSADVTWFHIDQGVAVTPTTTPYGSLIGSTANIRSYWPLDETTGTTFTDYGPSSKNLTIVGSPTLGVTPLITAGHAATFSGSRDGLQHSVQYATSSSNYGSWGGDGSITVEAWVKTTFAPTWAAEIVGMDDGGRRLFQFRMSTTFKLEFITFDSTGSAAFTATGATTINTGATFYLAAVHDGTANTSVVYVNAVSDGSTTTTSSYTGSTPVPNIASRLIGAFQQVPFGGTIDEVAIYSRALTAAEISQHYAAGLA